jgi:hypothetical protein
MAVINMRISNFQIADIPGCDVKTLRQEFGWFRLSADSVRLENRTAKLSEQDRCHRQNNFEGRPEKPANRGRCIGAWVGTATARRCFY